MPTVYITAPRDSARELAETLVEEHLAACVNYVECQSVYRFDGEIHNDDEMILLAKTSDQGYGELESRVLELHPYDVPCIERFDEDELYEEFGEWIHSVL